MTPGKMCRFLYDLQLCGGLRLHSMLRFDQIQNHLDGCITYDKRKKWIKQSNQYLLYGLLFIYIFFFLFNNTFTFQINSWVLQLPFKQRIHQFPQMFEDHANPYRSLESGTTTFLIINHKKGANMVF